MDQYKVGRFIALLRKEKSMTQRDLASKLGITNQAVSKWERGENLPDISMLVELARIFDISVDEILNAKQEVKTKVTEQIEEDRQIAVDRSTDNIISPRNTGFQSMDDKKKLLFAIAMSLFVCSPISFFIFDHRISGYIMFFAFIGFGTCLMFYSTPKSELFDDDEKYVSMYEPYNPLIYGVAGLVFLFVGFFYNKWHPTWMIFLFANLIVQFLRVKGSKDKNLQ